MSSSNEMIAALNAVSVEDIVVSKCVRIPDDAKNAMSIVAASDYRITFREETEESEKILSALETFLPEMKLLS